MKMIMNPIMNGIVGQIDSKLQNLTHTKYSKAAIDQWMQLHCFN